MARGAWGPWQFVFTWSACQVLSSSGFPCVCEASRGAVIVVEELWGWPLSFRPVSGALSAVVASELS